MTVFYFILNFGPGVSRISDEKAKIQQKGTPGLGSSVEVLVEDENGPESAWGRNMAWNGIGFRTQPRKFRLGLVRETVSYGKARKSSHRRQKISLLAADITQHNV